MIASSEGLDVTTTTRRSVMTARAAVTGRASRAVVIVSRHGDEWRAVVAGVGVVGRAQRLAAMDRRVRKSLGTRAVEYHFRTGDAELDRVLQPVRTVREAARAFEAKARLLVDRVLTLHGSGSYRDLAVLLGMSHQRLQQINGRRSAAQPERGELWH